MNIAELFVTIGLKGDKDVGKGLKAAKGGLGELESSALLAKAAVLGVIAGLERMTGFASQIGMDLFKFGQTTGLSTDELQKWQYAAMKFDVSGEEMANTIRGVQNAMTDMALGKGAPEALGLLAQKVGFDPKRMNDTFYVMQKLQEFAKTMPPGVASNLLKSFGISDNVFQMLKSSNLEVDKISKKDIISQRQIEQLTKINKAWKEFWFQLKMIGVRLVSGGGMTVISEFMNAFKFLEEGIETVIKLAQTFDMVKYAIAGIGIALGLAFAPLTTIIAGITLLLSDIQKFREGKDSVIGSVAKWTEKTFGVGGGGSAAAFAGEGGAAEAATPGMGLPGPVSKMISNVFHVNTTVHGVPDAKGVGSEVQKSVRDAKQQSSAATRAN